MVRGFLFLVVVSIVACGGGGGDDGGSGGGGAFQLAGTAPDAGDLAAPVSGEISFTFNRPIDIGSLSATSIRLETEDKVLVRGEVEVRSFNAANVRFLADAPLDVNRVYRVILKGSLRSEGGAELGADVVFTFTTASPNPTVRPDQLLDLGNRLNEPRFHARWIKTQDGRVFVFGGYNDPETVSDTIEEYDVDTRTFRLLDTTMSTPRADHTVTLLANGSVVIIGGVADPDGPPLASTEFFDPSNETISDGPDLNEARSWHGASPHQGGATVFVSGGFDANGDRLVSAEILGDEWDLVSDELPVPAAQHVQYNFNFDNQYIGVGGFETKGALFNGTSFSEHNEVIGGPRFRGIGLPSSDGSKLILFAGDTPGVMLYDLNDGTVANTSAHINPRRGDHSVTAWGAVNQYLIAGGEDIADGGGPSVLNTMLVARYNGDVVAYRVENLTLPTHFSGHVGVELNDGDTLLAGGLGDRVNDHSRRVVIIRAD